jgi:hypothetical protein
MSYGQATARLRANRQGGGLRACWGIDHFGHFAGLTQPAPPTESLPSAWLRELPPEPAEVLSINGSAGSYLGQAFQY